MILGLLTLSPLTRHLLCEQLEGVYTVMSFETPLLLKQAFLKGMITCGLQEDQTHIELSGRNASQNFPKPLCLPHLLHSLTSLAKQATYQIGPYLFSPEERLLEKITSPNLTIQLREKETELLLFLMTAPEGYAHRHTILQHIWGFQPDIETRTLETHIYQLRQKIEVNCKKPELLLNVKEGYQIVRLNIPEESEVNTDPIQVLK